MTSPSPIRDRIAAAPISWGVCEAPDWGLELAPAHVLREMQQVGLAATELGPAGYLGDTPPAVLDLLGGHGIRLVGGFVPVPMHLDPQLDLAEASDAMDILAAGGADVVVFAARSTDGSYDHTVTLTEDEWPVLLANLDRLQQLARDRNLLPTLHPHVGTAIESRDAVQRLLDSSEVKLCLDTGHLLIGGTDPAELLARYADRVAHVHLKDVNTAVSATVADGSVAYIDAVAAGLYTPLGEGDLDIAECVRALEAAGYQGWYVLEQDCRLHDVPAEGSGPIADVRSSIDYLLSV